MHSRRITTFLIFLLYLSNTHAQESYYQQQVDTRIDVRLDDQHHILRGLESIVYVNNSPDTLRYIYVHLWANAFSHDHTAFAEQQYRLGKKAFYYATSGQRGCIDSLQFSINGMDVSYQTTDETPDIARIDLPAALLPGDQITITTPFRVKLPIVFSRLGHRKQAYFISQWFPKPAVYDKNGWHPMPYLDQGEFFSEIGSYDVSITLPANYVVMATGNLQTSLEQQWLDSLSRTPPAAYNLVSDSFPASSTNWKTIRYTEQNVHDFAWFADKRFMVRKDSVWNGANDFFLTVTQEMPRDGQLSGNYSEDTLHTQKDSALVYLYTAYLPRYDKEWSQAIQHLKAAVAFYGKWVGPYPYRTMKVLQGDMEAGGGMEYPTVAIIDRNITDKNELESVIVHEAGHNWFYGMLATNERDYPWMDEGMNSFFEHKTTAATAHSRGHNLASKERQWIAAGLYQAQADHSDQPATLGADAYTEINYGLDVYGKTALILYWLEQYMGETSFQAAMQEYFDTWKHKHPLPQDFFDIVTRHTDKPISWFEQQLQSSSTVDFSIERVRQQDGNVQVTMKNNTGMTIPAGIGMYLKDSLMASVWSEPFTSKSVCILPDNDLWTSIRLLPAVPDGRTPNNTWRRQGIFHRSGIQIKPVIGYTLGERQKIYWLPIINYNQFDGLSPGITLHNLTFPEHPFQFIVSPGYGARSKTWNVATTLAYNWFPAGRIHKLTARLDARSASFDETAQNVSGLLFRKFTRLSPSLTFTFHNSLSNPVSRTLTLRGYAIQEDQFDFRLDVQDSLYKPSIKQETNYYGRLRYNYRNDRPFNPYSYQAEMQWGQLFAKLSVEGTLRVDYHLRNKSLFIRGYAGKFFALQDQPLTASRYYLNSTYSGQVDYLYDEPFIGRSETDGTASRQIAMHEGGLKIATPLYANPLGRSDDWLLAINVKTDLPIRIPVRLFADASTFAKAKSLNPSGEKVLYDAGIEIFAGEVLSLYIPLVMSRDFSDYARSFYSNGRIRGAISFSLNTRHIDILQAPNLIMKYFSMH